MLRRSPLPLVLACLCAVAAPAHAGKFTVSRTGNHPAVAVDASGTTHVVWDSVDSPDADDATSTTIYCKVPRKARGCSAGSVRRFAPVPGDQDFAGPRVVLTGGRNVVIVFTRCCSEETAADGQAYTTRVFAASSSDNGASFGPSAWIGTTAPDLGGVLSNGTFLALGAADNGVALQGMKLGGFAGAQRLVTSKLADTAGVGASPKGGLVAFSDSAGRLFSGALNGDPASATIAFKGLGKGQDVHVASGPKGVDLMYLKPGRHAQYVVRRFASGKLAGTAGVSEAGAPIFGNLFQDAVGRVHAVWIGDRGVSYRRSAKSGRSFGKTQKLAPIGDLFNLVIAANAKGKVAVAYDSNVEAGKVGGFTAG